MKISNNQKAWFAKNSKKAETNLKHVPTSPPPPHWPKAISYPYSVISYPSMSYNSQIKKYPHLDREKTHPLLVLIQSSLLHLFPSIHLPLNYEWYKRKEIQPSNSQMQCKLQEVQKLQTVH